MHRDPFACQLPSVRLRDNPSLPRHRWLVSRSRIRDLLGFLPQIVNAIAAAKKNCASPANNLVFHLLLVYLADPAPR